VLTAIENGDVGAVISWDMTRLTRNRRDTVRVIETGKRHETVLAFVKGSDLDLSHSDAGRHLGICGSAGD
jgi:site-specific DNA recombinase